MHEFKNLSELSMKTKFWLVSVLVLIVINLTWVWRFEENNREYAMRMTDSRNRLIQSNRELYLMNRGLEFSLKSNDRHLPLQLIAQPTGGEPLNFDSFVGNSRKLVLVLSDRNCSSCVDQLLFLVRTEISEIYRKNLLILYSVQGPSGDQWLTRQKILAGVEFLEIPDRGLQLPMDSLEIPYFFMTGPERMAGLTFTPYPSLEEQTKDYLNLIEMRFFN